MKRKYEKPALHDLSGISSAKGDGIESCTSGILFPNQCVSNGVSNATACINVGFGVLTPNPSCGNSGNLALDCNPSGFGAGV